MEDIKAQCIFCKIIAKEIPSNVIYEDDKSFATLDINPLRDGHSLLMPKKHYPILPLIPEEDFEALFKTAKKLTYAIKKAMVSTGSTLFIANGPSAGQNALHFLIHIIPRDFNDNIKNFNLTSNNFFVKDEFSEAIKKNFPSIMFKYLQANPQLKIEEKNEKEEENENKIDKEETIKNTAQRQIPTPSNTTPSNEEHKEIDKKDNIAMFAEIINLIEANPQLKDLFIHKPKLIIEQINSNPKLKDMFKNIDIKRIIEHYNQNLKDYEEDKEEKNKEVENKEETKEEEKDYSEIYKIINENPKLKNLIINDPEEFKRKVYSIQQIKELFKGYDLNRIIKYFKKA